MVFENLIQFNADSLEGFIVTNSLVGLGLVIAIYAFLSPHIKDLIQRRQTKLLELISERDDVWKKMSKNKDSIPLTRKYKEHQNKIKSLKRIPFHFDLGYQLTGILFFYSLTFVLFALVLLESSEKIYEPAIIVSFLFFMAGAVIFAISLIFLLVEIGEITRGKFKEVVDKEEKEDESEKHLKEIKEILKKSEKREEGKEFRNIFPRSWSRPS